MPMKFRTKIASLYRDTVGNRRKGERRVSIPLTWVEDGPKGEKITKFSGTGKHATHVEGIDRRGPFSGKRADDYETWGAPVLRLLQEKPRGKKGGK